MGPEEIIVINSSIISIPYLISMYEVAKNFPIIIPKLYSLIYMIIPIIILINAYIPLPGNITIYLSFAQTFIYYDVMDAMIVLFCITTSIMIIVLGINQWSDLFYSISFSTSWIISKFIGNKRNVTTCLIAGSLITIVSNLLVITYKYQVWKIIPISCLTYEIVSSIAAAVIVEVIITWIISRVKQYPSLER